MYKGNRITTSKYSLLTFLPRNLFLQFNKGSNLFFLICYILDLFPGITDGGPSAIIMPLGIVVGLSMIKDIYEDVKRHRSDNEENNRRVRVG